MARGRRPLRDKTRKDQELRRLTVALMKVREDAVIDVLDIEPTLKEAIIICRSSRSLEDVVAWNDKVVNMLRSGNSEDVDTLHLLVDNQEDAEEQLLKKFSDSHRVDEWQS